MDAGDVVGAVVIKSAFDFGADFFRGAKEVGVAFAEDGEFGEAADVADADDDGR